MSWLAKYSAPIGILLCFFGLALHVSFVVPPFENSDEAEHFLYAHTIASKGQLPLIVPREQLNEADSSIERWNNHAHHPPLYYLLNAVVISSFDRSQIADHLRPNDLIFTRNITKQNPNKWLHPPQTDNDGTLQALYFSRWLNTAFGLITLCLIYKVTVIASHIRNIGFFAMGFAAALPTFISIHSSISNDPLVVLTFSAGVLWNLRLLRRNHLSWRDDLLISLLLTGAALTKLTGVALWGVVALALILAIWRGHIRWQRALQTLITVLIIFAILAGWWYLRNWQLYGDPLALDATAAMWGRTFDDITYTPLQEIQRVALSFWMMIGYRHEPTFAPNWFYAVAALLISSSLLGWLFRKKNSLQWSEALLLIAALSGMIILLIVGTLNVDISYGRLLLPAIIPIALLLSIGWQRLSLKLGPLILFAYAIASASILLVYLPQQYMTLVPVPSLPSQTTPTGWHADNLAIAGLEVQTRTISPETPLQFDLYIQGNHPANPALSATLIDSITGEAIGQTDIYPGMAPTDSLAADMLYHVPINVIVDPIDEPLSPRAVLLQLRWYHVDEATWIDYDTGNGTLQDIALLVDERYSAPALQNSVDVTFSDAISLKSYSIADTILTPGNELAIDLVWEFHKAITTPHVLTIQIFDSEGNFITQADGPITGLPSHLWHGGLYTSETRTVTLPDNLPEGDYTLRVGWYHLDEWTRWPVTNGNTQDDLYIVPQAITIRQ